MNGISRDVIFEKVQSLMVELFELDKEKVRLDAKFEDLDLTSLDAIDLVVELQQLTRKKVSEEGLRKVRTVGDIVSLIEAHLSDGVPSA